MSPLLTISNIRYSCKYNLDFSTLGFHYFTVGIENQTLQTLQVIVQFITLPFL